MERRFESSCRFWIADLGLGIFPTGAPGGPNRCYHDPQKFIGLMCEIPSMDHKDRSSLHSHFTHYHLTYMASAL